MNTDERTEQFAESGSADKKRSGPPQFFVDATVAVNDGQIDKAIHILKNAVPQDSFTACNAIGQIYLSLGQNENALQWLQRACEYRPDSAMVIAGIGQALTGLGRRKQAIEELTQAIKVQPNIENVHLLAEAMLQIQPSQAVELLRQIVEKNPSRMDAVFELAKVLEKSGRFDEAEKWYKKILFQQPYVQVYINLADMYSETGRPSQAIQHLKKAIGIEPENSKFWSKLAYLLIRTGKTQEGISLLRKVIEKEPGNRAVHSNFLGLLHYLPDIDTRMFFDEHKKWGLIHAPIALAKVSHENAPVPDRRLRIGYISPDFRTHVVMYFFESLLDAHAQQEVEVYGYGSVKSPDEVTERLKSKFNHYRNIYNITDEAAARVIEKDRIDILVDIAGHTRYNRLGVLAYRPAPIQVTCLGHPDTIGMQQIDYRFTDDLADLPQSQQFYIEELVSLPDGFLCYRPPDPAPPVETLPAERNGYITFGSFNNNRKIHPSIIALWAEILKSNADSRFILKFSAKADRDLEDHYLGIFEHFGVSRKKVQIYDTQKTFFKHLQLYNEVDIALDTYPYNGTTTTCEALWMGVPVISLVGEHHVSRVGLSILTRVGLEFFAASTSEEYLAKAVALAEKPDAIAKIRASMRKRIADSVLCDKNKFTHNVETAYRKMWYRWCKNREGEIADNKLKHTENIKARIT